MIPNAIEFCFNTPLYTEFDITTSDIYDEYDFSQFTGTVDSYCIWCKQLSVFKSNYILQKSNRNTYYYFFECAREPNHVVLFIFLTNNGKISKIGQYPSMADIEIAKIQKYRKVLEENLYADFARGIGLATHGVGIGSYVYFRRVFENLVEEAHQNIVSKDDWNEEKYQQARMSEKVSLLQSELPSFLVKNHALYSILSTGIHSLREQECLKYFSILKVSIDLILDEKIRIKQEHNKVLEMNKALSDIKSQITE